MADGGAQNYVYDKMEQCIAEMQSFSKQIQQQAEQLTSQVTRLVDNGSWTGTSADDYKDRAIGSNGNGGLKAKLQNNANTMDQTGKAVDEGIERMKQADQKGGAGLRG